MPQPANLGYVTQDWSPTKNMVEVALAWQGDNDRGIDDQVVDIALDQAFAGAYLTLPIMPRTRKHPRPRRLYYGVKFDLPAETIFYWRIREKRLEGVVQSSTSMLRTGSIPVYKPTPAVPIPQPVVAGFIPALGLDVVKQEYSSHSDWHLYFKWTPAKLTGGTLVMSQYIEFCESTGFQQRDTDHIELGLADGAVDYHGIHSNYTFYWRIGNKVKYPTGIIKDEYSQPSMFKTRSSGSSGSSSGHGHH